MYLFNIFQSNNKKLKSELKETRILYLVALIHQIGILLQLSLNMKKDQLMGKQWVITEEVFQIEQVTKMIELKEENKEEPKKVRKVIQTLALIMLLKSHLGRLEIVFWLINNSREKPVTLTNNTSEHQKEALKVAA